MLEEFSNVVSLHVKVVTISVAIQDVRHGVLPPKNAFIASLKYTCNKEG